MLTSEHTAAAAPGFLPPVYESIPQELKDMPQWVFWIAAPNPKKGKPDKIPGNVRTGGPGSSTNPDTWTTFDDAAAFCRNKIGKAHTMRFKEGGKTGPVAGVGFVMTDDSRFVGIDIDGCIDGQGTIDPWAQGIVDRIGSYAEVSPSGTGIRIFVRAALPLSGFKHTGKRLEVYKDGRYLTVTGRPLLDGPIVNNQEAVDWLVAEFGPDAGTPAPPPVENRRRESIGLDDAALIEKILASKNGEAFRRLYHDGDLSGHNGDHSAADLALCNILAFWTGNDPARMDRLFRSGALYRAEKWDSVRVRGRTYGAASVDQAIRNRGEVYQEGRHTARIPTEPTEPPGDPGETVEAGETERNESRILPPPPSVPLEAFPAEVAAMLEEASEAFTVSLQIPAACMLAFVSRLVGRSRLISIKESWTEAGNLWLAVVADSGMGKSPCMKAFVRPVEALEYEAKRAFDDAYSDYEDDLFQYQTQRSFNAKQKAKKGAVEDAAPLVRPDEPIKKQAIVDDSTMESLGNALRANPKGLMWDKDELAGLMADADKYSNSSGGQRARLLSAYDCGPWKVERVSDPKRNLYIPKACIGIFGGIQPGMMPKVFESGATGVDEASGFLQRFSFIRAEAEAPAYWTERVFSREAKDLLARVAEHLWQWDIECDAEGREAERIVPVSRQAKAAFVEWYNALATESFLSGNKGLLEKLKAKALRISLLLHCLDAALAGTDGMGLVTEDCMRRALLLANWVKEHQEQCWRFFQPEKGAKQADPIERAIMSVVAENAAGIEADGWKISNADLCSLVEAKLNMPGLSAVKIGKAASGLGLPVCWATSKTKGRTVTQEKILSFKTTVGSVGSVGSHSGTREKSTNTTVGHPLVTVGSGLPAWAQPTDTNGSPTVPLVQKSIEPVSQPTVPTVPTVDSGCNFDFNDPAYPDEVKIL